jgi:selT/selW/selH selenoprotein domain
MSKPVLEIEYCTSCNYLTRALWVAAELMPDLQYDLEAVALRCGGKGRFEVKLGDQVVFSKTSSGRFPEPDELRQLIFDQMEARPQP